MKAMKKLMLACTLFAGAAFGQDNAVRERVEEKQRQEAPQQRDFTQVAASSVFDPSQLPRSGTLEPGYGILLTDALKLRLPYKMATWALCVAPTSHEDGTMLVIDSVQKRPGDKGLRVVEVRYRAVKSPGPHTNHKVWPYVALVIKGLADEVVCRPAQG
jgi:hypothetical protein